MEGKPNESMKNKPMGIISATEGQNDVARQTNDGDLAGFPAYNDGEGPSAASASTPRAYNVRCIRDVQAMAVK
jgi:hypothetical protein